MTGDREEKKEAGGGPGEIVVSGQWPEKKN
jgi:hypothetical protein